MFKVLHDINTISWMELSFYYICLTSPSSRKYVRNDPISSDSTVHHFQYVNQMIEINGGERRWYPHDLTHRSIQFNFERYADHFFFLKNALGKLRQKGIVQMVKGDTSTAEIKNQHTNFLTIDNGMLIMPIVGPKTFFICDDFLNRNAVKQYHLDREFQKHYHLLFWKFR